MKLAVHQKNWQLVPEPKERLKRLFFEKYLTSVNKEHWFYLWLPRYCLFVMQNTCLCSFVLRTVSFMLVRCIIYIWACDERCSRLTRVCILLFIFILLQLHETVVAFIQYTLMSSSSKNWQLWSPRGWLKTKILDENRQKAASGKWDNVGCSTSAENST